jgi:hypothetical protein
MNSALSGRHFLNGKGGRRAPRGRAWRSRRAVSDVVATILLLALTVVLFASIFAFVTTFPPPPSQNSNQFQAQLNVGPNGTKSMVTSISILHLAGPPLLSSALVYLKSSVYPNGPEFAQPYSLLAGGIPANHVWNLGQYWILSTNFTDGFHPALPDNITIYIVQSTSLLFSVVLPGQILNLPPTFVSVGTTPTVPVVGGAFVISAVIQGVSSVNTVSITVSGLPGSFPTAAQPMSLQNGVWVYSIASGLTTASGTYYAFITAFPTSGRSATTSVPIFITPYTTLIASALTVSASGAETKCAAGHTVAANGCLAGDFIYTLAIPASTVNFGSVLFEVLTKTGGVYSPTAKSTFSIVNSSTGINRAYYSQSATGAFAMTSTTPFTYPTAGVITAASGLSPSFYQVIIDTGSSSATWVGLGLVFVVIGQGSYYGTTTPASLP